MGCPVACLSNAKGVFPEDHDQFIGGYAGKLSDTYVRESIENADCPLAVGTQFTDSVTGGFSQNIDPSRVIALHPRRGRELQQHRHLAVRPAGRSIRPPARRTPKTPSRPRSTRPGATATGSSSSRQLWNAWTLRSLSSSWARRSPPTTTTRPSPELDAVGNLAVSELRRCRPGGAGRRRRVGRRPYPPAGCGGPSRRCR
ncbi:hypothetical protein [Streptomyces sp. NPDC094472]|uniref:hypothetical protein n=1 Tax=Streptomyces sp. NPDC094472 TaxID=3155080 RepID=UPI00332DB37D